MTPKTLVHGLTFLLLASAAHAAQASPVGVDPTGDASGPFGAASIVGDATTGTDCYDLPPPLFIGCFPLFAVTGMGDASGGTVSASGTGDASNSAIAISGTGDAEGWMLSVCASDPLACQQIRFEATIVTDARFGPDADADGVPAYVEARQTRVILDGNTQTLTQEDHNPVRVRVDPNDNDPRSPIRDPTNATPESATLNLPRGVTVGADADGDGSPHDVTIYYAVVTVYADGTFRVTEGPNSPLRIDPNDNDANRPVARPQRPETIAITLPTNVAAGPDADEDGTPAFIEVQQTIVTIDLDPAGVTFANGPTRTVPTDDDTVREVHVNPDGDAHGSVLAVSATGDATSCEPRVTCIAISITGDANGYYAASGTGDATACTDTHFLCAAASGTGDATSTDYAASGLGSATGGDAGASLTGPASGTFVASGANQCNGGHCIGLGQEAEDAHYAGINGGSSRGIVAVSFKGDAEGGLVAITHSGNADAPVAINTCQTTGAC